LKSYTYFTKYWRSYLLGTICLIIINALAAYIPQLVKNSINIIKNYNQDASNLAGIEQNILFILVAAVIMALIRAKSRHIIFGIGRLIEFDLKRDIFSHLLSLEPAFFNKNKTGDLISIITNDVQSYRALGGFAILNILNSIIAFSIIVPIMWQMNSWLTLSFLTLIPILIFLITQLSYKIKHYQQIVQEKLGNLSHFIEQNLSGIHIIKAYAQEEAEIKRYANQNQDLLQKYLALIKARSLINPIMRIIASLGFLLLLYFGGKAVINEGMNLGDFTAYSLYIERLIWPIATLGWLITVVYRVQVSSKRIKRVLNTKPKIKDHENSKDVSEFKSEIELTKLGAKIVKGQKLGLVGTIGSGKSILASKLMHLTELEAGEICLDGHDLKNIKLCSLRSLVTLVPQNNFLFSTSVANNIAYAINLPADEIEKLAKAVILHDEIMKFPDKYETLVGERGVTLSGGQRQRMAIARALALNPEILILDDALSSVDDVVAEKLLNNIYEYRKGKTTIFITHKMKIMPGFDNILVMDKLKIVEQGRHGELLAQGGLYKQLYSQVKS
jgi:ATP-binding cassette subfamily B protein